MQLRTTVLVGLAVLSGVMFAQPPFGLSPLACVLIAAGSGLAAVGFSWLYDAVLRGGFPSADDIPRAIMVGVGMLVLVLTFGTL